MDRPTRDTPSGRVYLELRAPARRQRRPTDELLVLHVLERFLHRVSLSPHRARLVLKDGMLLAALAERRATSICSPTRQTTTMETVAALVREALAVDVEDGVVFDTPALTARAIRSHRCSQLRPLRQVLVSLGTVRQSQWEQHVRRTHPGVDLPPTYQQVIAIAADFADPILTRAVTSGRWDPLRRSWQTPDDITE